MTACYQDDLSNNVRAFYLFIYLLEEGRGGGERGRGEGEGRGPRPPWCCVPPIDNTLHAFIFRHSYKHMGEVLIGHSCPDY